VSGFTGKLGFTRNTIEPKIDEGLQEPAVSNSSITVRELAGEIWWEWMQDIWRSGRDVHIDEINLVMDIVLGVTARHIGCVIEDDQEMPVTPSPEPTSATQK